MAIALPPRSTEVIYPDSDGQPMSDNTLQWEWIAMIKGGLEILFKDDPAVFVAGDLLWYPVEGDPKTRTAPDAMVAFGRPKGYRGSYKQWQEGSVAPQVVFEVLSPGNRTPEMLKKFRFYERFGVEEYYVYDPEAPELSGWLRGKEGLDEIPEVGRWVSPRLGVVFDLSDGGLRLFGPDGRPFSTHVELAEQRERAEHERERERAERERAEHERDQAERERDEARRRGDEERQRTERLAARLRELGVDPD